MMLPSSPLRCREALLLQSRAQPHGAEQFSWERIMGGWGRVDKRNHEWYDMIWSPAFPNQTGIWCPIVWWVIFDSFLRPYIAYLKQKNKQARRVKEEQEWVILQTLGTNLLCATAWIFYSSEHWKVIEIHHSNIYCILWYIIVYCVLP